MRAFGVFIGICLLAYTSAGRVDMKAGGGPVSLIPQTGAGIIETRFDVVAPAGCKMTLFCVFETYSCRLAKIKVDNGERFTQHCPEVYKYVSSTSYKNRMTVTFENSGPTAGAKCYVQATKPYIDIPEKLIDSSEHGLVHRSKKPNSCKCGWTNKAPSRIVGGREAGLHEYPFPVLIMFASNRFPFCGGSIITERHILTAAHCTDPFRDRVLAVAVGEHDVRTSKETKATKIHIVKKIYQHEGYDDSGNVNDIAILEVDPKIEFNDKVGPVCIPTAQQNHADQYVKVMGWGLTKDKSERGQASPVLRKVNLRVIHPDVCKTIYRINTSKLTQICTYNNLKDSCQGDSGGPLVRLNPETNMYEQVALVSYGRKCGSTDPAVNTDVAAFLPWIKKQIGSKGTMCF
uniref:Venom S1 protease 3 n=1 Tax=Platymeris rhadamanthus TaxID=1134088 RepID=A0A6B9KZD6_PLARH|nr:venom S1 protease 3 [Platymeris rhadamanthus]